MVDYFGIQKRLRIRQKNLLNFLLLLERHTYLSTCLRSRSHTDDGVIYNISRV
jgi:hypothetical protein